MAEGPQPVDSQTLQEKLDELDNIPLFMKSLPEDEADNPTIAALQSLAHEGPPDEVAQNFKEHGNEYFKGKRYREAISFYTQGIDANPPDPTLKEALYCNRAAASLGLKNYGSALRDCAEAIKVNSKSPKGHYRSAQALIELERWEEALDCCTRALSHDSKSDIKVLLEKATKKKEEGERKEKEKQERLEKEKVQERMLRMALRSRNIMLPPLLRNSPNTKPDDYPHFDPEDPTYQTLIIPVYFEYPEHGTFDVIPQYVEDTPFALHLGEMFPPKVPSPGWDKQGKYVNGNLVVYASTKRKRLLKVGKNMSLRDVCNAAKAKEGDKEPDGLELTDGHLTVAVVSKGEYEKRWVEDFKKVRES
ncbi:40s ribosomal protein s7 [Moniliophthora roreri MCA 2997]|uniref:40s ribosomal protein s7 n=1 Tax=Moniliophthora roreri (strain MCA 2997) TaxID=1381753 RepID=V2XMN2_MONRO|nr:40s ribosomal protein s7 [Moniliophthora roreri MCA 2997]